MIEFDETMSRMYSGKEAISKRIETRLKHTTYDIPYYDRGVDIQEFTYGSSVAAIKLGLRDFGPELKYDSVNSRVQIYDIIVPVNLGEN